jgi:hypothetical protein
MPPPQNKRARRGRDEGSVSFHKPSGLWRGVLSLGRRNGVRYRKTVYGPTPGARYSRVRRKQKVTLQETGETLEVEQEVEAEQALRELDETREKLRRLQDCLGA